MRHYTPPPTPFVWRRLVTSLFLPLTLAMLLVGLGKPPVIPTELGPQQMVVTRAPQLAVHTRLTDEVESWKIKQTLVMVRLMGASTIIEYFPWAYMEPRQGRYNWDHADQVIDHARRQGLKVVARIDYVPDWARPAQSSTRLLPDDRFEDYARFVGAFAERYRGRVEALVIWNEPNVSFEWGGRPPDAVAYTRLLAGAYQAAKAADPSVQVWAGALAPTLASSDEEGAVSDLAFLAAMYDAGAAPYFDGLTMHAYGWNFAADDPPDPAVVNFRRVELLRAIMVRHGDGHKPAPITEAGWNDHPRWTKAVRPSQRIVATVDALDLARGWEWAPFVAVWAFRFPWANHSFIDNWALVDPDFTPRPLYTALAAYAARGSSDAALEAVGLNTSDRFLSTSTAPPATSHASQ